MDFNKPTIIMTSEEFEKRWDAYNKSRRQPKKVFMQDGKMIAGENISMGDLVYIEIPLRIAPRNSGMSSIFINDSLSETNIDKDEHARKVRDNIIERDHNILKALEDE